MSSVDSKIVTMKFDNAQFESGAKTTISTLDKLKQSLHLTGATKGLEDVQRAADGVNLSHIQAGTNKLSAGFIAMSTIAVTALATITQKAMAVGSNLIKSFTLEPIKQGFNEYETKMKSIQTILANTAKYGTKLEDVTTELDKLNEYADKTIYSFEEMTRAVGLFTNSGMRVEEATTVIKGFSNAAAASGATAENTARAQYQLSQAFSTGTIRLMDWKSLTNAGMGNKNMQTSLIEIADAMGAFEGTTITANDAAKDFNGSLEKNWLKADVMKQYLSILANEVTPAQMKSLGLSDKQIERLQQEAKTAEEAATKVRTFTQLLSTLKEAVGSGWAATFDIVIGDFKEATKLFTDINDSLSGLVKKSAEARNKMLQEWKDMGGRDTLIDGLKKALEGLKSVIKPITEAFRDIFPATTAKDLYDLTVKFKEFAEKLKINDETAKNLHDTFEGIFAVFSIVKQIIGGVVGVIFDLVGAIGKGSGGFLDFTAGIGRFITGIDEALKKGDGLAKFFDFLSGILQTPIKLLSALGILVVEMFRGFSSGEALTMNAAIDTLGQKLSPLKSLFEGVQDVIAKMEERFQGLRTKLEPFIQTLRMIMDKVGEALSNLGNKLLETMTPEKFSAVLDTINTALFAGILLLVRKFINNFSLDFGGGFLESIKDSFGALTDTLGAMQANIKANTLLKIAGAVGLLTVSIVALSMIDSKKLMVAMVGVGVAMGELLGAMTILTKITTLSDTVKMVALSVSLTQLSTSMLIMSFAIERLAKLSWEELSRGLVGVGVSLGIFIVALKPLLKHAGGLVLTGIGLVSLSVGLALISGVVTTFSEMDWTGLGKGMGALVAALGILIGFTKLIPPNLPLIGLGLLGIAIGVDLMASSLIKLAQMDMTGIMSGLTGMFGILVMMLKAISLMPPTAMANTASLILFAVAVKLLGDTVTQLGNLKWDEVGRGLFTLAAGLTIMGVALHFISTSIMGAVALAAISASLMLLVPALVALGNISWAELGMALAALATTFILFGVAAAVLSPVAPIILMLAASLALLGVAIAGVGAGLMMGGLGVKMFAEGLKILVELGGAAIAVIGNVIKAIIDGIPPLMVAFAEGLIKFVAKIAEATPEFIKATVKLLNGLMEAINQTAPNIIRTMTDLLLRMLKAVVDNSPAIIDAGYALIINFLSKLRDNIGQITTIAADLMGNFLTAISDKFPDLADKAAKMIIKFVNATANAVRNNSEEMGKAGGNLASAIIEGFVKGVGAYFKEIGRTMQNLGAQAVNSIKAFLGIASPSTVFMDIGRDIVNGLINGIVNKIPLVSDVIGLLVGTILGRKPEFDTAGAGLGNSAVAGFVGSLGIGAKGVAGSSKALGEVSTLGLAAGLGITPKTSHFKKIGKYVADDLAEGVLTPKDKFETVGSHIALGMAKGLLDNADKPLSVASDLGDDMAKIIKDKVAKATGATVPEPYTKVKDNPLYKYYGNNPSKVFNYDEYLRYLEEKKKKEAKAREDALSSPSTSSSTSTPASKPATEEIPFLIDYTALSNALSQSYSLSDEESLIREDNIKAASQRDSMLQSQNATEELLLKMTQKLEEANAKPRTVRFEQNNYSPKELSAAEIYQQTQNQLSMAKEVLAS